MARTPVWGGGARSRRPLVAAGAGRGLWRVGGAALVTAAAAALLHLAGGPSPLSPGPLAAPHVTAATRCADCHASGRGDAGCTRCHAAGDGQRFAATGHAPQAPAECTTCHGEHRGSPSPPVADAQCAACHFVSLDVHPSPLPRPQAARSLDIAFSHARHLDELRREGRTGEAACGTCHGPRARLSRPRFDACAGCHAAEGPLGALSVPRAAVVLPQELEAAGLEMAIATEVEADDHTVFAQIGHRDPWLLFNLERAVAREAVTTARALAAPCLRCHPGAERGRFAAGASRSLVARFDHGRHPQACASCHGEVAAATALPLPRPDPAGCLDCHRREPAVRDCAACHRYHPRGVL